MKKIIYILAFIALGLVFQSVIHSTVEIAYIQLLLNNYDLFGLGLSWSTWFLIHKFFTAVLIILGAVFGFKQGRYWWRRIYLGSAIANK